MSMTLKKVGDDIRDRLDAAQANGVLPYREADGYGYVRYDVRVSNSKKKGPAVNIVINGYEFLIPDRQEDGAFKHWRDNEGAFLIAAVDKVAARDRYKAEDGSAVLCGITKLGICVISVTHTGTTHVSIDGTEAAAEV